MICTQLHTGYIADTLASICATTGLHVDCYFHMLIFLAAAKKCKSCGDSTSRKSLEAELSLWFVNSRDRGSEGRKNKENRTPCGVVDNHAGGDSDNANM